MKTFEQALGKVLAERRLEAKLSQEALAAMCDVHATYVSQLERGLKSPTVRTLRTIARALRVPAAELLTQAEQQYKRQHRA